MTLPLDMMENFSDLGLDLDDEVFGDYEDVELRQKEADTTTTRVRRVSDVIDSLGEGSPVHRTLVEAMENDRRLSDPPKPANITRIPGPQRHSDGFIPSGRPKSIYDDGYGSSSTVVPQSEYVTFPTQDLPKKPVNDTLDAKPINSSTGTTTVEANMPVHRDSAEYNMNHRRRGKAVIFNHDTFTIQGISARKGSDVDSNYLEQTFNMLDFEVVICNNFTRTELVNYVAELSKEDFSDADCLCIAVLTHGIGSKFLLAKDMPYTFEELWEPFTGDKCITLAGKPKLFFIQACRGDQLDGGVTLVGNPSRTETDSSPASYKIPSRADFLFAYSSVEGFYSWRNPENGTWFIQCLCKELQKHSESMELQNILKRVLRKVALDHESYNDLIPWQHQQKQVPSVVSMLIRDVYFKRK